MENIDPDRSSRTSLNLNYTDELSEIQASTSIGNADQFITDDQAIGNYCDNVLEKLNQYLDEVDSNKTHHNDSLVGQQHSFSDSVNQKNHIVENDRLTSQEDTNVSFGTDNGIAGDSDYAPDNPNGSDSESDPDEFHITAEAENGGKAKSKEVQSKRERKRKPDKNEWYRNKIKKLRLTGKEYKGYQRNKNGKITQGISRPARKLAEACKSVSCEKSKQRFCKLFYEETRLLIFNKFWNNMGSWEEKKGYVLGNVEYVEKKRQSTQGPSRRKGTYLYYLRAKENERKRVCKKMFLGTLGLKEDMVHDWLANTEHGLKIRSAEEVQSLKTRSDRTLKIEKRNYLRQWFEILPKISSHYCRKDTNKLYLEQLFQSKVDLYRVYQDYCKSNGKSDYIVSNPIFDELFQEMNLSLYKPKKDRCDICCAFEMKNVTEADYANHTQRKERARQEKEEDKKKAIQGDNYTLTIDVQAVKICPVVNASAIYYKMKLNTHNFTVYNLATHESTNYWWNETEGDLSASTFATFLLHYIRERCSDPKLPIVIYSDGCCYQNRNVALANALFQYSLENSVIIEQKYLEKGHTQMECDSVHALIEKKLKNRFIHLPSDYMNVTREARKKPCPLDSYYVTHRFFKDYSQSKAWSYNSIRPGKKPNDPTVTDLRHLHYSPTERKILYKINFDDQLKALPVRNVKYPIITDYPSLHKERLPIKFKKWKHLQDLKHVLPDDCKEFYDNLPHVSDSTE